MHTCMHAYVKHAYKYICVFICTYELTVCVYQQNNLHNLTELILL